MLREYEPRSAVVAKERTARLAAIACGRTPGGRRGLYEVGG
jgi:hypothetical protein